MAEPPRWECPDCGVIAATERLLEIHPCPAHPRESAQSKPYEMLGEALHAVRDLQTQLDEAWDLIDKMTEYVQIFVDTQIDPRHRKLLEEIEKARSIHG